MFSVVVALIVFFTAAGLTLRLAVRQEIGTRRVRILRRLGSVMLVLGVIGLVVSGLGIAAVAVAMANYGSNK